MTDTPVEPTPPAVDPAPSLTPGAADETITALADEITQTGTSTGPESRPADGAVLRYGKVTAVGTGANAGRVQTDATGAFWAVVDAGYNPAVNDLVYLIQQGPVAHVVGKLGGTQPTGPPVGQIIAYAGATAPAGWLACDGAAVSRTTYAALFAVCGTTYGSGDGSTTFNIPNLTDRVPTGYGPKFIRGEAAGSETFTLTIAQLAAHTHGSGGSHTHTGISHDHTGSAMAAHDHAGISHDHTGSAMATHDHAGSGHTHTATHDHTGSAMPTHDHPGSSHSHTATQGTHSHPSAGSHSHVLNAGSGTVKGVTGGSGGFLYASGTTKPTTDTQASHSHGSADAGVISVASATAGVTPASAGTPNVATYTGDTGSTTAGVAAASAGTPNVSSATAGVASASAGTPNIGATTAGVNSTDPGATASTGSGSTVNNMPPYLALLYCIRALP